MPPTVHIHFVCRGNAYRSRTAEAYAKSLRQPDCVFTSSGIAAATYPPDFISPWAVAIGKRHGLTRFFSEHGTQTTDKLLKSADIIVFLSPDVFEIARKTYDFNESKSLVWHVADSSIKKSNLPVHTQQERMYRNVKRNVDKLLEGTFNPGGWVDIVNEHNQDLGFSLPLRITNQKALWHRGCHAIITTPTNRVIIQKRSDTIIFSPKLIDITLGGHVDAGESPEHAMVREIREESGLVVMPEELDLLEVHKWGAYRPKYKVHANAFIYTYHVKLPEDDPHMTIQKSEVALMKTISPRQLQRLLVRHRIRHLGSLCYSYAFFQRISRLAGILPEV